MHWRALITLSILLQGFTFVELYLLHSMSSKVFNVTLVTWKLVNGLSWRVKLATLGQISAHWLKLYSAATVSHN